MNLKTLATERKLAELRRLIDVNARSPDEINSSLEMFSLRDLILDKSPHIDRHDPYFKLPDEPSDDEQSE